MIDELPDQRLEKAHVIRCDTRVGTLLGCKRRPAVVPTMVNSFRKHGGKALLHRHLTQPGPAHGILGLATIAMQHDDRRQRTCPIRTAKNVFASQSI
jgi:hypothetical protein